ncbi:hypothetical protein FKP32DRAFT_1605341 [Trametes sanguinea]|nr:hypothetical protein FKP32DRAFT_1605341 [Trametes sanguinea]
MLTRVLPVKKGATVAHRIVKFTAGYSKFITEKTDSVSHLGEIGEDLYTGLRSTLLDRLRDKEPTVRTQAVIALSKLSFSQAEDPVDLDEGEPTILETILDAMADDTSPPHTLPALLARSRDVDAPIRKLVYSAVLEKYCTPPDLDGGRATVGFTHARALTIAQRETIVRNGLSDREESVKAAARNLLGV